MIDFLIGESIIEKYLLPRSINIIDVKREDLACPPPGPPFAKVRGLLPFLLDLKDKGVGAVGYMETSVSMAGWGISYFCKEIGLKAVIFSPQYSSPRENQIFQFEKWKEFEATIIPLERPNRMQINFYRARKILVERFPGAVMLPLGLPFSQTVEAVSRQVELLPHSYKAIVVCIGSGTMAAGILKGLNKRKDFETIVYGIFVSPKNERRMSDKIMKVSGIFVFGNSIEKRLKLIDTNIQYTEKVECDCPFPCNEYYDLKAWKWLVENYDGLPKPVLFWNIGSDYSLSREEIKT